MTTKFKLEISMDNAAFSEDWKAEVMRILARVRYDLSEGFPDGVIRDYNGNVVGSYRVCPNENIFEIS